MRKIDNLLVASIGCFVAALLHIAILFGGADWFRFFGAGEEMAKLVEAGSLKPMISALAITVILTIFGLYGLSIGKRIPSLPLKKLMVGFVAVIFSFRGIAGFVVLFFHQSSYHDELAQRPLFMITTSLLIGYIGVSYFFALLKSLKEIKF